MKIHLVTIGKPKLAYAQAGWSEYVGRLQKLHTVRLTQLADKYAYDAAKIAETLQGTYVVALEIHGESPTSEQLAGFLTQRELAIASERICRNETGVEAAAFKLKHALTAFKGRYCYRPRRWNQLFLRRSSLRSCCSRKASLSARSRAGVCNSTLWMMHWLGPTGSRIRISSPRVMQDRVPTPRLLKARPN